MGGISIHENVLNSLSSVYSNADRMHWIIDKIPDLSLLNTAEWRLFLPQLYKQYPNDDMDLNVSITSPPLITVAQNNIDGEIYSDVTIDVLDAGNTIPVACISLVFTFSGYPEISRNGLAGRVELNDFTMFEVEHHWRLSFASTRASDWNCSENCPRAVCECTPVERTSFAKC